MTKKRIKWTVKVINQRIEYYQRKLSGQLKLQVESMFHNGLFDCSDIGDIESNIKKYEIIIADLETILLSYDEIRKYSNSNEFLLPINC